MHDTLDGPASAEHEQAIEAGWADRLTERLGAVSPHVALLAAWLATCGSLFISEVIGWQPCLLCWYQRIAMYPLALLLPIGILRRDRGLHFYVLPLALLGAPISLYHYLLIKTNLFPPPPCTAGIPCTVDYIDWFGFINIPFLALTAFLIIIVAISAAALTAAPEDLADEDAPPADEDAPAASPAGLDWSGIAVFAIIAAVLIGFIAASALVG
jgi:disulfide bond formation protein DsbB